jgi:tetratricopeptide (TPR) repeat protein
MDRQPGRRDPASRAGQATAFGTKESPRTSAGQHPVDRPAPALCVILLEKVAVLDHPTPAILRGFLLQTLSQDEVRSVVAHLLPGCARCAAEIASSRRALSRQRSLAKDLPTIYGSYDAAFERALAATLAEGATDRYVRAQQSGISLRLRGLDLCKALLKQSRAFRHEDPSRMVQLARRAVLVANSLSSRCSDTKTIADYQCRAWAELGNAYRVADGLDAADDALGRAFEIFGQGSQEDRLQARLFNFYAALAGTRRQFETARAAIDITYNLYFRLGDRHLAGRALITKGVYVGYSGEPDRSVYLFRRGLAWIDHDREPDLRSIATHNIAYFLKDCGRLEEAQALLRQAPASQQEGHLSMLKRRWLEGRIDAGLGRYQHAEETLLQVRNALQEAGLHYKAAAVSLHLEEVWLDQGRYAEAREAALEAEEIFQALRLPPHPTRSNIGKVTSGG